MTIQAIRFNKTNLLSLIKDGQAVTVKDVEVVGLKFKVGKKRSVFQYEKRISGRAGKSGKSGKKSSPVTFTIGAFPAITIDDARQEARRIANLCEKGIDPREEKKKLQKAADTNEVILGDAIDKFFEVKKELAKKTIKTYREIVKNQFPEKWMDVNMLDITPEMIAEHFHVIRETARERCWKFLKIYGNIWNTCKPFFKNESGERILKQNPIPETRSLLTQVKTDQPKRSVVPVNLLGKYVVTVERLRSGEIQLNPEKVKAPTTGLIRIYDILLLSLFTAFRWTEAQNLKWEYVNLDFGIIRLPGDARDEEGDFDGTKNHHDHWIPLSSYAWDLLRKINTERDSLSAFVFPSVHNPSKPIARFQKVWKQISEKIGTHLSPHTNRRTFASSADAAGLGYLTVKRLLNHAFQGGVTGGYIVAGFDPSKERANFQRVCDYILDRRSEHLGLAKVEDEGVDQREALLKLKRFALELGLDPVVALEMMADGKRAVA